MKVTNEIHDLAVEALESNRHVKDRLQWLETLDDGDDVPVNEAHQILVSARAVVGKVQEISNRVAGYAAPRSGE